MRPTVGEVRRGTLRFFVLASGWSWLCCATALVLAGNRTTPCDKAVLSSTLVAQEASPRRKEKTMASQTKPGPSLLTGAADTAAPIPAGSAPADSRLWFLDHLRLVLV